MTAWLLRGMYPRGCWNAIATSERRLSGQPSMLSRKGRKGRLLGKAVRQNVYLLPLGWGDLPRIRELLREYADRPMDLADAALIRIAEREGIRKIFTVDKKDFSVYRIHGRIRPSIMP